MSMPRVVDSYDFFFPQGIPVEMGTGTGRNLFELGYKLSIQQSELYACLIYIETPLLYSVVTQLQNYLCTKNSEAFSWISS
jgi:hypothetical protein